MTKFNNIPLFAQPVSYTNFEHINENDKKSLYNLEYFRPENSNCWFSKSKYVLDEPQFSILKSHIMNCMNDYVENVLGIGDVKGNKFEFYMCNSWLVKHSKGDYGTKHEHPNSLISGILYLSVDNESGKIYFHRNNLLNLFFPLMEIPVKTYNIYNSKTWNFQPENNQLFFFPSSLEHSIDPHQSDIERYCLVFNFFARGKLGYSPITQLTLN